MNFILAVGITTWLLVDGVNEPAGHVRVENVAVGSPAELNGVWVGDVISDVTVGEKTEKLSVPKDLINTVNNHKGEQIKLTIIREGKILVKDMIPRVNPPSGEGPLGVTITDMELKKYSLIQAPGMAVKINFERAWLMLKGIGETLWNLITLRTQRVDVAGPIGIAQVTGEAVKFGIRAVLEFMSILSLNLAVLNILPIPALDGGRLAFVFIEKLIGRRVKPAFEKQTHQIGMIILLFLVLLVSIGDIMRLARGG